MSMYEIGTVTDFRRLVTLNQTTESLFLEFKKDIPRRQSPDPNERRLGRLEFARDLSQFANTEGGCVLLGIAEEERSGKSVATAIQPISDFQALQTAIEQAVQEFLVPTTVPIRVLPIELQEGLVVAINVPPHVHLVWIWDRQKHSMECLRRNNHGKEWLNPDEVERHLMNASRASRLCLLEVTERCRHRPGDNVRVQLSCGVWSIVEENQAELLEDPDIFLGTLDLFEFGIRINLPDVDRSPTLALPYEVVRASWRTSDGRVGIFIDAYVVARTSYFINPARESEARTTITVESAFPAISRNYGAPS